MDGFAKELFDQMNAINEGQALAMRIGRAQFARDVNGWITRVGVHRFGDIPIGELIEMCRREAQA